MSTLLIQSNLGLEAGALEQGARDHYGDHHHHEESKDIWEALSSSSIN